MATIEFTMPDDLALKLSKLENKTEEITEKVVTAAGKAALPYVKEQLDWAIGNNTKYESRTTGELKDALGLTPVDVDKNGLVNVKIGFFEPRKKQYPAKRRLGSKFYRSYYTITNAMIANVIEYGKHGQPAKPFMARAKRRCMKACRRAAVEKFEEEISKL